MGLVKAMHTKFELANTTGPTHLTDEEKLFRARAMQEELNEIRAACLIGDLEQYFDGIIDLVYVALGAAYLAGLPFEEGFRRVHEANMKKVRAITAEDSKRGSTYDIVKPAGWEAPVLDDLLRKEKA
jgi:predicted HAD superfamily Cof-like phosphohydrolase